MRGRSLAEQRQLGSSGVFQRSVGAAEEEIGFDSRFPQKLDRMLTRLRLLLTNHTHDRNHADVDVAEIVRTHLVLQLLESLQVHGRFNVADGTSELNQTDIGAAGLAVDRDLGNLIDPLLDRVSYMRDHLHSLSQVVTIALLLDDLVVDLTRRDIVTRSKGDVQEALVVTQVEIRLTAVLQNINFAVLKRGHGASVDVQVWIDLHRRNSVAMCLENDTETRNSCPLTQTGHSTT